MWVVTLPAIWDDSAKEIMLEAAKRAGLPVGSRFTVALEPEAAALYCRKKLNEVERQMFQTGAHFLVVDCTSMVLL